MNDILAIKNYILYLKKECNLAISLHTHDSKLILKKDLLVFNIHENPYCVYVKSCRAAQEHCIKKQAKIMKKCENGSFTGVCWAGVKEYVYPITYSGNVVGFICVSGFACDNAQEYLARIPKIYDLQPQPLQDTYRTLKKQMPDKAYVDTLIYPLCHMLELAHLKGEKVLPQEDTLMDKIIRYIKQNYSQNITSQLICQKFQCSRAYFSKLFNEQTNSTFREYLTHLRIEAAKSLLHFSHLDVSEIALSVGFNEPNYFTAVFKKYVGVSPSAYKKSL